MWYATFYLLAIAMFVYLSPFVRYSQSKYAWSWPIEWFKFKCKYANVKVVCSFLCWQLQCLLICCSLQNNHIWTSQWTRFKYLTFKMKVKYVDDSDENLQANVPCQYACAKIGASMSRHLLTVHNRTFHGGCTDEQRTYRRTNFLPTQHCSTP